MEEPITEISAVAERWVDLWSRVIECISRAQDELEEMYNGGSLPDGLADKTTSAGFRNYTVLSKRLSGLLGKAQLGFQSASRLADPADGEHLVRWGKFKRTLDPALRDRYETLGSLLMARGKEAQGGKPGDFASDSLPVQANRLRPAEVEQVERLLQSRITEMGRLEAQLRQIEENLAGSVVGGSLSQAASYALFRRHSSDLKRLVNQLVSSQKGFHSALEIYGRQQSVNLALQERLYEMTMQAYAEWFIYHGDTVCEASGIPFPEEILRSGRLPPKGKG